MLYYTNKAAESAIQNIERLQKVIGEIPGNCLSYTDAEAVGRYLAMLSNEIRKEQEKFS